MSSEDRRPDWNYWKNVPEWTILEAVALSMDIDPNKLHYKSHRKTSGIMIEWVEVRDESPEFEKRLELAILNIYSNRKLKVTSSGPGDREKWEITHASFAALAVGCWWTGDVPPELAALAEPDKRDAEILDLKQQVEALTEERDTWKRTAEDASATTNAARGELTKAQHAKNRERTLAAVLATIATADREGYINKTGQKIVVTKLAGLVEDNRTKYEKPGKILSVEEIKNLVGKVLNGGYFS